MSKNRVHTCQDSTSETQKEKDASFPELSITLDSSFLVNPLYLACVLDYNISLGSEPSCHLLSLPFLEKHRSWGIEQ